ncbi:hypothetical protein KR032_008750 [Drosophila birchii]|nr:hypothetical protein KR032_008750 [Drosophila birchii]
MSLKEQEENKPPRDYLQISCFVVGALELIHSLTLAFNSIYELSLHQNVYNITAYLGAVVYVLTVKALVVGIWKGVPKLFVFWLMFAGLATATSIVLLIWNILSSRVFDKEHFIQWSLVYLGIFYECFCLLLVFRYYRKISPYTLLAGGNYDCPEKGKEIKNKYLWLEFN